ncbi:ABC transporter ATP-binding protein [Rhizobium sp. NXC24]|uniref:ABC transporter ATP-binding protein n=1 Tax=Rhizobium sp. NXC24 TaxID=2048897 RepID=UPI000CDF3204|nr:ABC transporter ATP-binding protein [Rhizobium sp. NXC24]AVA23724.1 nitrate/sulfonate ABC transporter ATP-binding protein [Rhizobium sp. NXC24]
MNVTVSPSAVERRAIALDVENVSHHFVINGEKLAVLDNVDLSVKPGEFIALLGPSGCGKSTLLRLAAGLDTPREGRLLEEGAPITAPDPSRILVFQDPTLFPWRTVRKNVATGLEARGLLKTHEARVDEALRIVKLEKFADAYPNQLSGGMAQRVAIARALVNDPHLLLLDEPFGKLDSLTRLGLQQELTKLWQDAGFTAILVTHDVEEALLLANRVIVFSDRPARIVHEVSVDKPFPRKRDDEDLVQLRQELLSKLGIIHG